MFAVIGPVVVLLPPLFPPVSVVGLPPPQPAMSTTTARVVSCPDRIRLIGPPG